MYTLSELGNTSLILPITQDGIADLKSFIQNMKSSQDVSLPMVASLWSLTTEEPMKNGPVGRVSHIFICHSFVLAIDFPAHSQIDL